MQSIAEQTKTEDIESIKRLEETKSEKPMTREQRRLFERIENEANKAHQRLTSKFVDFMIESDDLTEEVIQEKAAQISAQWKMFCKSRRLKDTVLNIVHDYCQNVINEYKAMKENKQEAVKPNPETVLEAAKQDELI